MRFPAPEGHREQAGWVVVGGERAVFVEAWREPAPLPLSRWASLPGPNTRDSSQRELIVRMFIREM